MHSSTSRRQGRRRLMLIAAASTALLLASPTVANAANDDPGGEAATADQLLAAEAYAFPPGNWWDSSKADKRRAAALLRQMTLAEKVDMLHGEINNFYGFYNAPIDRLGIPALTMADGPAGTRIANPDVNGQRSTQLPSPLALAATWNAQLGEQYGDLAGSEAFDTGHNVLLSPAVDIARVAQAGRAFEAYGEDPLLSGTMGAANLRGIQSNPVVGDIKHYNVYTQETNRLAGGNAVIDERALQEIYTRPYAIGIRDGHPGSAMCAFNAVNGVQACENGELLNTILKEQLKFQGWVMSDYGATHSTVPSILNGLDQEMPGNFNPAQQPGMCFFCGPLIDAVNAGQVPMSRIDDAVTRILRPMFALGLFDNPPVIQPLPEAEHGAEALSIAEQAMVLLKNDAGALPLTGRVGSIAVIGADADTVVQGGGSSQVKPTYTVSPLEGIQARAGSGVAVNHVAGSDPVTSAALIPGPDPIPSDYLTPATGTGNGLRAEYFLNRDFSGAPELDRTDPYAGIYGGFFLFSGFNAASPHFPPQPQSVNGESSIRWSGSLTAPVDGSYQLSIVATGSSTLYLDGAPIIQTAPSTTPQETTVDVDLAAGSVHELRAENVNDAPSATDNGPVFKLGWVPPEGVVAPQAVAAADLARNAQAAVVVVRDYSSEGGDRPNLNLPNGQEEVIRQVAAANPNTIVVVTSGAGVETSTWEAGVPAILQAWYGGQEQGNAIANILFGDVNPSGKLPITVPTDEASTPVSSPEQFPGVGLDQQFSEGIFVGYRGYEEYGITPQYAFGHGLSYTSFDYSKLKTSTAKGKNGVGKQLKVDVTVRNTGTVAGRETVQVYVGPLPTREVPTAAKALAGWAQVDLQPGERKKVSVTLSAESLSFWDVDRDRWRTPSGDVPLFVGSSSDDIRLTGDLRIGRIVQQ
ncbi:glycoside hydrolase family 3 [Leifsonia sp. Leaf325]|nr:glycoside hydrolase family 3 C-terminal domain-containing protein [Leifsonia sp. Leaf325]KQQ93163.1 glycoside hydrolase family 3 [Leifsonia sp. Leaf325]